MFDIHSVTGKQIILIKINKPIRLRLNRQHTEQNVGKFNRIEYVTLKNLRHTVNGVEV